MQKTYRDYFDIDPEYFSVVNAAVIEKNPDLWKKFYPHETFVKLLRNVVDVLELKKNRCLWVEGAYGTGKSHAVLTLKKLLDADEPEINEYFDKHRLDQDLRGRFLGLKENGRVLTVHRYGSSSIRDDVSLVVAIQSSVEKALADAGIKPKNDKSVANAVVKWLSDEKNRKVFNIFKDKYSSLFGGDDGDAVLKNLKEYAGAAREKLVENVLNFGEKQGIDVAPFSVSDLCAWIREVVDDNKLKILFIWDEFTEYFKNNSRSLTGFQELCELSAATPFFFVVVTHAAQALFHDHDREFVKLSDRFVAPRSVISLPENIAFQLVGKALVKKEDKVLQKEWEESILSSLSEKTKWARNLVLKGARVTEEEILGVLPIHPYAAILLKHLSSAFDSNQRSIFDFINSDHSDEGIKDFQWFIDTHDPYDDSDNCLTVDMLWDFFYIRNKENLASDTRDILDYYLRVAKRLNDEDQQRVLKTILLLLAISQHAGDAVELLIPDEKNLKAAFDGTYLEDDKATQCAESLVRGKILYKKPLGDDKFQYAPYAPSAGDIDTSTQEAEIDQKPTTSLVKQEFADKDCVANAITLRDALKLRHILRFASASDFKKTFNGLKNDPEAYVGKIPALVCFAKDDAERVAIGKEIHAALADYVGDLVVVEVAETFGDEYKRYRQNQAKSNALKRKEPDASAQYETDAEESLKKWKTKIAKGAFVVYTREKRDGERACSIDALNDLLADFNKKVFPRSLEGEYSVTSFLFDCRNLKLGVECAVNQRTVQGFSSSNPATKLENALKGAWNVEKYWESAPSLLISKIKIDVDSRIQDAFQKQGGQIAFKEIYDHLKTAPYGFLPCNLSAFILGFVLKEYVGGSYSWSDGVTCEPLELAKLKEAIDEVIKLEITPNPRYRRKYLVSTTKEERAFNELAADVFDIPLNLCVSIPNTRERVREKMKELSFPIWILESILEKETLKTDPKLLKKILDYFCKLANCDAAGGSLSENEVANVVGNLATQHPNVAEDLKKILCKEKCEQGMRAFLESYDDGKLLALAEEIGDQGRFINEIADKFDADAAKWVWNRETGVEKIQEVVVEYSIVAESNKILPKSLSYSGAIHEWLESCNRIRVSYPAAENELGEIGPFLETLYNLKKTGEIRDDQKEKFLKSLEENGEAFRDFYENRQLDVFKRVCAFILKEKELSDEEVEDVFQKLAPAFSLEKGKYLGQVEETVKKYKEGLKSERLKTLWRDKTGSKNPRDWSKRNKTPILALIPEEEFHKAKAVFSVFEQKRPDEKEVDQAIRYLENATFWEKINDQEAVDQAFNDAVLKRYAVILTDPQEVKDYLNKHLTYEPYDWFANPMVDKELEKMADYQYAKGGYQRAWEIISTMDVADVKDYLKDLVKNNMIVGIEIIKKS